MIPIYLCDDEKSTLGRLQEVINEYISYKRYDMEIINGFSSPEDLLSSLEIEGSGGLYFLDVDLKHPRYDGFSLGAEIRKIDPRGFIVYVTAFSDFAFKSFEYHIEAMDYIIKENPDKLREGITRCLDTVSSRRQQQSKAFAEESYVIKLANEQKYIRISDIYYFETTAKSHHIMLYAEKEVIDFLGSMQEIEKSLGSKFLRVHRSYIVNLDKVSGYDFSKQMLTLENGRSCLVARKMKSKLLQALESKAIHYNR